MSIYGNPMILGGGGSGGNAYALASPPIADIGRDGDYYFELSSGTVAPLKDNTNWSASSENNGGWEFSVPGNSPVTLVGVRGYSGVNQPGSTASIGTSDGVVFKQVSIDLLANQWVDVFLDSPITLSPGTNYIVKIAATNSLKYIRNPSLNTNMITYVRGRYGSAFPGTAESGVAYSADVILDNLNAEPPYSAQAEYYKAGGLWVSVSMRYGGVAYGRAVCTATITVNETTTAKESE